jgi:predicted metalloprotease with PDZ domain
MRALLPLALLLLAAPALALAQAPVRYELAFPNAVHHEAEITVTFGDLPAKPLEVRISRSSPGRYALHEFGKNVYNVKAVDGRGRPLTVQRPDPYGWTIAGHDGTVRITYTLFADHGDGTYAGIDLTHAHFNAPAALIWARGLEDRPAEVRFAIPAGSGWKVATQLVPTADPAVYTAPNFQYLMDSPIELSDYVLREWPVESNGKTYTIRLAVHHWETDAEVDAYTEMAKKVVAEQMAVFGELPNFDFGTYTFLADYHPYAPGDGMEHRNSTILTSTRPLSTGMLANLGTLSHEFFHVWNTERLRAASLEPFDFERANMTEGLWLGEGFTSYYDQLTIHRAGLTDLEAYLQRVGGALNVVINSPGRQIHNVMEMSMQAPYTDASTAVDLNNRANTFISYYTWGSMIGLGLDLTLRTKFKDLTLDDFMRELWRAHGRPEKDFAPTNPYTMPEVVAALGRVTKDQAFAEEFFNRYVAGHEVFDYETLLGQAGLLLRKVNPGQASLGRAQIRFANGEAQLMAGTLIGSPLYQTGLSRGDRITSIDGRQIRTQADIDALLAAHKPGDQVTIAFEQRGRSRTERLILGEDDRLEVVAYEKAGRELTPAMRRLRGEWLGSRQPAKASAGR